VWECIYTCTHICILNITKLNKASQFHELSRHLVRARKHQKNTDSEFSYISQSNIMSSTKYHELIQIPRNQRIIQSVLWIPFTQPTLKKHKLNHSILHLECHFCNLKSLWLILISRSLLPRFIEKRPTGLKVETEMEWHSRNAIGCTAYSMSMIQCRVWFNICILHINICILHINICILDINICILHIDWITLYMQ